MISAPRIRLRLFGSPSLFGTDDTPLCGPPAQRHRLALLALLALSPERGRSRETLMACLWPERDSAHARLLLNQSVHALRRALGKDVILSAGDELRLDTYRLRTDVAAFREAIEAGELLEAVGLYAAPFLDGFSLPGALEFERWAEGERERFRQDHCAVLEGLAGRATAEGDLVRAVGWWRRRVAADPYDARATLRLMEALLAAGDRSGAIREARAHAMRLERDLDAEPDPQVAALARRLRREPAAVDSSRELQGIPPPAGATRPTAGTTAANQTAAPGGPRTHPPLHAAAGAASRRPPSRTRMVVPTGAILGLTAVLAGAWLLPEANPLRGAVTAASANAPTAVAVVPCTNLNGRSEAERFGEGLTDALISHPSEVRRLPVPVTPAFAFAGRRRGAREIGRALEVRRVLQCGVRRDGDRVRVTAQLIDATDGFYLWADTYEREGTDASALQTDLAQQIVRMLEAEPNPAERTRLARRPPASPEAYALTTEGGLPGSAAEARPCTGDGALRARHPARFAVREGVRWPRLRLLHPEPVRNPGPTGGASAAAGGQPPSGRDRC